MGSVRRGILIVFAILQGKVVFQVHGTLGKGRNFSDVDVSCIVSAFFVFVVVCYGFRYDGGLDNGWYIICVVNEDSCLPVDVRVDCAKPRKSQNYDVCAQVGDIIPVAPCFLSHFCCCEYNMRDLSGTIHCSIYIVDVSWEYKGCHLEAMRYCKVPVH